MSNVRVLLVDDSPDFLRSARQLLEGFPGLIVVGCAAGGAEALELVALLRPELVLLDLMMPLMNGLEATALIKAAAAPPRIVLLTLHDNPYYRAAAAEAGADGYISKTCLGRELLPLIVGLFPGLSPGAVSAG